MGSCERAPRSRSRVRRSSPAERCSTENSWRGRATEPMSSATTRAARSPSTAPPENSLKRRAARTAEPLIARRGGASEDLAGRGREGTGERAREELVGETRCEVHQEHREEARCGGPPRSASKGASRGDLREQPGKNASMELERNRLDQRCRASEWEAIPTEAMKETDWSKTLCV